MRAQKKSRIASRVPGEDFYFYMSLRPKFRRGDLIPMTLYMAFAMAAVMRFSSREKCESSVSIITSLGSRNRRNREAMAIMSVKL